MQTWRISKGNILCFGAIKAHNNGNTSEHLLSKCSFQKCKKNQLHSLTLFKNYLPLGGADEVLCFWGETNSQQSRVTLEEVSECGLLFCCFFVFLFFCFFRKRNTWISLPGLAAAWSHTQDPASSHNRVSLKSSMQRSCS